MSEGLVSSFFVSPLGDDANAGSMAAPFKTFERARDAMRHSTTKVANVSFGAYLRTEPLVLTKVDDGETWVGNTTAEIDGGGELTDVFLILGGSHITIDGFRIKNVRYRGVGIHGGAAFSDDPLFNVATGPAAGNTVRNTEVSGISAPRGREGDYSFWNSGGVVAEGLVPNTVISNNYFHDTNSMGVRIGAERPGDDISGSRIDSNVVVASMGVVSDGGAIYVQDAILKSTDISITHNYIYDFQGSLSDQGRGIYLDQSASNVTVAGNIIRAGTHGAEGSAALIVSGGSNNTIANNIIDLGCSAKIITAIFLMPPSGPNTSMKRNSFQRNLVLSNFRGAQNTSTFNHKGYSYFCGGGVPLPTVADNAYFNASGRAQRTDGNCVSDAAPLLVDPAVSGREYRVNSKSPVLNAPVSFVPIREGWGPNSSLPEKIRGRCATGNAALWPGRLLPHLMRE